MKKTIIAASMICSSSHGFCVPDHGRCFAQDQKVELPGLCESHDEFSYLVNELLR